MSDTTVSRTIARAVACAWAMACAVAAAAGGQPAAPHRHARTVSLRAAGWHDDLSIALAGVTRYFRVYVPPGLPARPAVVFVLHGGTQSMRKIFRPNAGGSRAWRALADEASFLVIAPTGVNERSGDAFGDDQNWHDCRDEIGGRGADDVGFITALIDWADDAVGIDRSRVYATGASNGGGMCYRLAIERPDRFAAFAVFIMNLPRGGACGAPARPVPMFICNGTADPLVPWAGGGVARGRRGEVMSAAETLAAWQAADHTGTVPGEVTHFPDLTGDNASTVVAARYLPVGAGAEVMFVTVEGGGHAMPTRDYPAPRWALRLIGLGNQNRDVEGARLAWDFLSRHRLGDR